MSNKIELLRKIKTLAERGIGGEKEGAQLTLSRLMKKYGIDEEQLEKECKEAAFFSYSQEWERRLLNQIIYMVTGEAGYGCVGFYSKRKRKQLGIDCTVAERLEIDANYEFYKRAVEKELEIFLEAFVQKNRIFPSPKKSKDKNRTEEPEDLNRLMKIGAMMEGMERYTLMKLLESQSDNEEATDERTTCLH